LILNRKLCAAGLFFAVAIIPAWAVSTQFWTTATFEDFSRGNFTGISLSRDGSMTLAPQMETVFDSEQAMIWAVARDSRGTLYFGTGHSGKVFRMGEDLKATMVFDAEEPDVFALAVDKDNRLYVGTSPDGKVYRVGTDGKANEFYDPKTKYIWSLAFAPDGALYVGTGDRGRVFRVAADGTGEVFYETNQTHVMTLAVSPVGDLVAGTEPNGLLYRISGEGKAFVLYDAPQGEIHKVTFGQDGSIYAAVMGGSSSSPLRQSAPQPQSAPAPVTATTSITVRASDDPLGLPQQQGGPEGGQGQPDQPQQQPPNSAPAMAIPSTPRVNLPMRSQGSGPRSAIVRILPDNTVDTLWTSTSENAFDLTPSNAGRLLFSTDEKGRVYQLVNERELSLLTQTDQEQTTRLIPMGNFVLLTTANLGKVFKLGTQPAATGTFESEVRDAGNIAGWGQIRWKADLPQGTSVELFTRTGNSSRPDTTWSEWSAAYKAGEGEPIRSPAARYAQWKAVFHSSGSQSPVLREVTLAYLPRNRAPEITEVKATARGDRPTPGGQPNAGTGQGSSAGGRAFSGLAAAARSGAPRGVDVSWLASDPDQDDLSYTVYFRGEGEGDWKLLQENLRQNYLQLNPDSLPDGYYRLRVVASDGEQNPAATARTTDRVSAPFLVDYSSPQVEVISVGRSGGAATVTFRAADSASGLTRAEYALDAEPLQPVYSDDGIVDARQETFTVKMNLADSREHLITLRVYDSSGNVGVGKAILPAGGASPTR
jgi:hypothetical protein